jgi:hypothetical protein
MLSPGQPVDGFQEYPQKSLQPILGRFTERLSRYVSGNQLTFLPIVVKQQLWRV